MIPKFPKFKKLEFSDQDDIEQITFRHLPYSDFNFSSLWSWDTKDNISICTLNGNLVVKFTDHFSDELFCSFLGPNLSNNTIEKVLMYAKQNHITTKLRLVPEISLEKIDLSRFMIEIDADNSDYVFDINALSTYESHKFSTKRKIANSFFRKYSGMHVKEIDLNGYENKIRILQLNTIWSENKSKDKYFYLHKENLAIERFLSCNFRDSLCVGIINNGSLIGYSMFSLLPNRYTICHFSKADINFNGIYEFLMRESCKILKEKGYIFMNYEEDLGISGLRYSKNSYKPIAFLRKYTIQEL